MWDASLDGSLGKGFLSVAGWTGETPSSGASNQPVLKILMKVLGLVRRKNSRTDTTEWMSNPRGEVY